MALFSTTNMLAFDEVGVVKKNVKIGDKIYSGEANADTISNILNKYQLYATQRTIDVVGKNVHEFTVRIKPAEQMIPTIRIDHLLQPHYEVEMAS